MQIRIKEDAVEIDGYVNAIERKSKPLRSRIGQFVERICKGAFKRAIERNDNIRLLLNHDRNRDLGGTRDGNLELAEDPIGLHARATISDPDVIKKARNGDLVGWSFGFGDRDVDEHDENGIRTRDVKDMDLYEVSILDRSKTPAYEGTLVSVRDDAGTETVIYESEPMLFEAEIRSEEPEAKPEEKEENEEIISIDYSKYEKLIQEMKGD